MTYDDLGRPPLDGDALRRALTRDGSLWRAVQVVPSSASTNADLAARARAGEHPGVVLVTEHQTAGRGRLDRTWVTPPSTCLTFSVLVQPDRVPVAHWPWLPLLTGVAVVEALRRACDLEAGLKWPNDVLVGERKLAGVLVERVERPTGAAAVIGVGLNVSLREDELPVPSATSLRVEGAHTTDRTVVLREVLRTFEALYRGWEEEDGDPERGLRTSYLRRCRTVGRPVRVELPDGSVVEGTASGVDAAGRLEVRDETSGATRALGAGDVVHVRGARPSGA